MKIQGSNSYSKINVGIAKEVEKKNDFPMKLVQNNSDPISVSISEDGMESYRKSLSNLEGVVPKNWEEEFECRNEFKKISDKIKYGMVGINYQELRNLTNKSEEPNVIGRVLDAYSQMYEKIVKGYEEGTREIWVPDSSQKYLFRKLTMEEDLAALDKALVPIAERASVLDYEKEVAQSIDQMLAGNKDVKMPKRDEAYEDRFYSMMIDATKEYKKKFNDFMNPSQGMSSIIKQVYATMKNIKPKFYE